MTPYRRAGGTLSILTIFHLYGEQTRLYHTYTCTYRHVLYQYRHVYIPIQTHRLQRYSISIQTRLYTYIDASIIDVFHINIDTSIYLYRRIDYRRIPYQYRHVYIPIQTHRLQTFSISIQTRLYGISTRLSVHISASILSNILHIDGI